MPFVVAAWNIASATSLTSIIENIVSVANNISKKELGAILFFIKYCKEIEVECRLTERLLPITITGEILVISNFISGLFLINFLTS